MRTTRAIRLGGVQVGGGAPVSVQSMTNTDTRSTAATLSQIGELVGAGCDIVRVAVPNRAAARALPEIVSTSAIPVVADIHFDHRLALQAVQAGVHGIRINPGNIGSPEDVRLIAEAAAARRTPIRVGVNAGSLEPELYERFGGATAEALVQSALGHCEFLERIGFTDIKVSLKASEVRTTVAACRLFAERTDYPLHLGLTEAGTPAVGVIKSAVAIGALLLDGIGDTIRVSLTAPPVEEVRAGLRILRVLGLRRDVPDIVACPTCGRTRIDLMPLVEAVEREVELIQAQGGRIRLGRIAIMGCAVNGPGEARDADLGVAAGDGRGVLFRKGEVVRRIPESALLNALKTEIRRETVFPHPPQSAGTESLLPDAGDQPLD